MRKIPEIQKIQILKKKINFHKKFFLIAKKIFLIFSVSNFKIKLQNSLKKFFFSKLKRKFFNFFSSQFFK